MMDLTTLKQIGEPEREQYLNNLEDEEAEELLNSLLGELSEDNEVTGNVYEGPGCYFIIYDGRISEISDDASCSPRGGWFPDIVTGLNEEQSNFVENVIDKLDLDDDFFDELYSRLDTDYTDEAAIDCFEDNDDEENAKKCKKLFSIVEKSETAPSVSDFTDLVKRRELDYGTLYYEWEGDYIDLLDNIGECGEERGSYEGLSAKDWIDMLLKLDSYIVTVG